MQTRYTQPSTTTRPASRPAATNKESSQQAPATPAPKPVEFVLNMPQARSAAVAGSFNNWDVKRTPMRKDSGSSWKTTLSLPPGRYEYRFVVDGEWINDPNARETTANPFGGTNSVLVVKA